MFLMVYIFCNRLYKLYCKIFFRRDWQLTSNELPRNVFVSRFLTKWSPRFPQDNGIDEMILIMFITSCLRKVTTFANLRKRYIRTRDGYTCAWRAHFCYVPNANLRRSVSGKLVLFSTGGVQHFLSVGHITNFRHLAGPHEKFSFLT